MLFYGAGETGKDSDFKNGDRNANGYNAVYANNYISVPVYFKAYFSEAPSEFLQWRVRFNFLVNQNVKMFHLTNLTMILIIVGLATLMVKRQALTLESD